MISKPYAALAAALIVIAPALARGATPDNAEPRYSFSKVEGGFLRLDMQTGQVSLCGWQGAGWACVVSPEDRAVLETEIARLRRDNAMLKKELLSHDLPLPQGVVPEPPPPMSDSSDHVVHLPNDADVDRVVAFVGQVWHRLVEVIANAQNQILHRT